MTMSNFDFSAVSRIPTTRQNKGKKMKKLVCGVGVNDLPYRTEVREWVTKDGGRRVREIVFRCEYYVAWVSMLTRCYSEKYQERYPSYIGTSVCSEWLYASAFRKWMEQQDWRDKCLDKDIIAPGNKLYSPDTCAFVLNATNLFVTASDAIRGEYPIGVDLFKPTGKYRARCKNLFTGEQEHLGYFSTPEEAHEAWRKRKHELAQLVAAKESDPRIVEALKKRYSYEEWYK